MTKKTAEALADYAKNEGLTIFIEEAGTLDADTFDHLQTTLDSQPSADWIYFPPKRSSKLRRLIDRFGLWLTLVNIKSRYVMRDPYDLTLNEELRHEITRLTKELKNARSN